jgi:sensor histidine kinase YesM
MRFKTPIRLLIHSAFWILYTILLLVFDCTYYGDQNINWYDKIEFGRLALVITISYINGLVLLPFFIKRKLYIIYTIIILGMVLLATLFSCYYILECVDSLLLCFSDDLWIITIPVVSISLIWMIFQFLEKQKELEKAHQDKIELELKILKYQINPHVLFNSLNTIYSKAVIENDEIAEMILMLSENLKYVLNQSDSKFVNLEKDISFIENYLEFQKLRTQDIIRVNYKKNIDSYTHSIAPLILIDFIENAFKFSYYKNQEASDIDIYLEVKNGSLHFNCKNEYDSTLQQKNKNTTQIGLKNLKQRLNLIYQDKYQLKVFQKQGKYIVDLKINLQ